jgi:hydroxylamine oxidation protein HaoB
LAGSFWFAAANARNSLDVDVKRRLRLLGGILLLLGGGMVLLFGLPRIGGGPSSGFDFEEYPVLMPGDDGFPSVASHYPIRAIERFGIGQPGGRPLLLQVADYQDDQGDQGDPRRAIVFLPASPESGIPENRVESALNRLRWQAWLDAAQAIDRHVGDDALFVSWWDNAQRIHFLTGKRSWLQMPAAELFDADYRDFWRRASGGFSENSEPLRRLADWLTMDADKALASISQTLGTGKDVYLLASTDDLARMSEIGKLSGRPLPFETRLFQTGGNIHNLIARVKRWAREKGSGSYLVQRLPGVGVRTWRIAGPAGEKMLIARLLPFTSSLSDSLPNGLDLVHRSDWGGYLSIFRWRASESVQQPKEIE